MCSSPRGRHVKPRRLSFDLDRGRTLGIVGESGSGKSVTNLAILGLHNPRNTTIGGEIVLDGQELTGASERTLQKLRGKEDGHGLPGLADRPVAVLHGGPADRRAVHEAQRRLEEGGESSGRSRC